MALTSKNFLKTFVHAARTLISISLFVFLFLLFVLIFLFYLCFILPSENFVYTFGDLIYLHIMYKPIFFFQIFILSCFSFLSLSQIHTFILNCSNTFTTVSFSLLLSYSFILISYSLSFTILTFIRLAPRRAISCQIIYLDFLRFFCFIFCFVYIVI